MRYAEVAVNSPAAQRRAFSYRIPDDLNLVEGQPVWVPFGSQTLQGIILKLTSFPAVAETRDIAGTIETFPLVSPSRLLLAQWISAYYLAPLFESVALMLPPGFERRILTFVGRTTADIPIPEDLSPDQTRLLELIHQLENTSLREIERKLGRLTVKKNLPSLINLGLASKSYQLEKIKVKPRMVSFVRLAAQDGSLETLTSSMRRSPRQAEIIDFLKTHPGDVSLPELKQTLDFSDPAFKSLKKKGLVMVEQRQVDRDPLSESPVQGSMPLDLTPDQARACQEIASTLRQSPIPGSKPQVFLLHGVTGSGKTEVYLRCLEEAKKLKKKGIVMVPEISLTPQTIERFAGRFPGNVAVLHSQLSLGEQFDEWWRIFQGEFDVVIGPRSAVFAPQPDLGLIILDEAHEWTYKQADTSPRYHARQVALKLAELSGAAVVLGSATPDVENYFKALRGDCRILNLPVRINQTGGLPLPSVDVVDMRQELKRGNYSVFSRELSASIEKALNNSEQVLLFLNRRAAASIIECRDCGFVICCKRCEIPLSYHLVEQNLMCHQCGYHISIPQRCPHCRSQRIKYLGVGTEKLEQEAAQAFPQARILRWDSDIVRSSRSSHQTIFKQFKSGQADILIGTQMIAKGLDFPNLSVVGVVNADIALNLPDFRGGERCFQLLSQVSGRAGRGSVPGKVVIQTYSPDNYAIQAAAKQDYRAFYEREVAYRRQLHNPPFSHLARLVFTHKNDARCQQEAERVRDVLVHKKESEGLADLSLIGPAPAFYHRLRGRFRWQIVLRGIDPSAFLKPVPFPKGWTVDIDPVGL